MIRKELDENGRDYLREEYIRRINCVIDYIEANLDKNLSLETLSEKACFSRYHFHRLHGLLDLQPEAASRMYADAFPNAGFTVIDRAGHFPYLAQPAAFSEAVALFCDETGS